MARKAARHPKPGHLPAATPGVDFALPVIPDTSTDELKSWKDRDLLNQLLGQAQMAEAFAKFSATVTTSKIAIVKENKLYQSLKGRLSGNGYQFHGTWDEFCGLLNVSREKADLDIANLRTFGEEALESMSRMGIGYRELRQFRKLPDDSKSALIEVAKQGDKESLLDLAEELIARQTEEKEKLSRQLADREGDLEASRKRAAELKTARDALEEKLSEEKFKPLTNDELAEKYSLEATSISNNVINILRGSLRGAFTELEKDSAHRNVDHDVFMAGLVCTIRNELDDITARFTLPNLINRHEAPDWLTERDGYNTTEDRESTT